jgi:hypothetical protein
LKFLGRAKKFLQDLGTESPSKAQTFNLSCASGHRVRGERTEGYQALRCPACGEGVFVLPRSPLPEPEAPAGMAVARGGRGRPRSPWADEGPIELTDPAEGSVALDDGGSDGAEIIWDEEPVEPAPRRAATTRSQVAPEDLAAAEIEAARRAAAAEAREGRPPPEPVDEPDEARPGRERPDGRSRSARPRRAAKETSTPARAAGSRPGPAGRSDSGPLVIEARSRTRRGPRLDLIFASLAFLILATVAWRAWMHRRAQYPLIIEQGRIEGIPALEAGEFDRAYQLLSEARAAVDHLGGAVEDADKIRQAADEAAVFNDLCPESLENLLAEVGRKDRAEWESNFDKLYKGRYYLFDSIIVSAPANGSGGAYEIGYVVFPPGEASRFGEGGIARPDRFAGIDLAGFELLDPARTAKGDHVTFGAKLRAITYDGERKQWMVQLERKSGVFITHTRALMALGWPEPESVELPKEDQP